MAALAILVQAMAIPFLSMGDDNVFEHIKFNHTPKSFNTLDVVFKCCVANGYHKKWRPVLLAAIVARRFLNEGFCFAIVLEFYERLVKARSQNTAEMLAKDVLQCGYHQNRIPVLENMLSNYNEAKLLAAMQYAIEVLERQPRTGYMCRSVEPSHETECRPVAFARFIGRAIQTNNAWVSLNQAILYLPEVITQREGFQAYQVSMMVHAWAATQTRKYWFLERQIAGPGMIPMCLALVSEGGTQANPEWEAESEDIARPRERPQRRIKCKRSTSWMEHRIATGICTMLTGMVKESALMKAVCAHLSLDVDATLTYDETEYFSLRI